MALLRRSLAIELFVGSALASISRVSAADPPLVGGRRDLSEKSVPGR
ncbi:hypothetical protein M6B38_329995 [Iris pallida]|uniref:Uncharacterized protein n=1 Tax=Iris pallida TaxID=29817 RepID=A0AAX6G3C4_IRIPA|nr:hypothetical protein M6B38_386420 [Iris pallida]KAJ6823033.1 hypothetical protein M6B38_386425 [Iris pallida]KAJ6835855.1 hypothetical protein M6B38_329995 [Iris pallida]